MNNEQQTERLLREQFKNSAKEKEDEKRKRGRNRDSHTE